MSIALCLFMSNSPQPIYSVQWPNITPKSLCSQKIPSIFAGSLPEDRGYRSGEIPTLHPTQLRTCASSQNPLQKPPLEGRADF